jgi:hypothetical protein
METKKPNNPSAFPVIATEQSFFNQSPLMPESGMTLRDHFAGLAMQGLMSMEEKGEYQTIDDAWRKIAEYSYQMANAMLKVREETES